MTTRTLKPRFAPDTAPTTNGRTPTIQWTHITPDIATKWLNRNSRNRPLKPTVVKRYARAMKEGRFRPTAQGIVFDWNGDLLDGQHRLWACIESGASFYSMVVWNEDPENFRLYDIGVRRRGADVLALLGHRDTNVLSAAAAHIWRYERGNFFAGHRLTPDNEEIIETVRAHPRLSDSLTHVGRIKQLCAPSLMVALHYLFARRDHALADLFIEVLKKPDGESGYHPVVQLRERFIKNRLDSKRSMTERETAALTIKAWNALSDGREVRALRWNEHIETFPEIQ